MVCLLLAAPHQAQAQISTLKKAIEGTEAPLPAPPEKPEDARKRLELWNQEARDTLNRLDAAGSPVAMPAGITPAELDDRRRDLEQMALLTTSLIKNFGVVAEARKSLETARAEEAAWTGFTEPPPYSILMIDELLNERDAIKAKISSYESSLANLDSILSTTLGETKAAEEVVSTAIIAVQNSAPDLLEAAKWRLEAARLKSRFQASRASYLQSSCDSIKDRIASSKSDLALVERKIKTAAPNSQFSGEDLAKIGKIADERRQAVNKEITAVSKRLKTALATRTQAQAALDALLATATEGKEPEGLQLAKFRVEVADDRIESLQSVTEGLESLIQIESLNLKAYQGRRIVMTTTDAVERRKAIESISLFASRLNAWLNVMENETATCGAELSKIESRAASISTDDPRFPLVNEQRAARSEKLAMHSARHSGRGQPAQARETLGRRFRSETR